MLDIVSEARNERTFAATLELISNLEIKTYRSGKTSVKMLNYRIMISMSTLAFQPIHPFFDEFYFQILRMLETGLFSNTQMRNPRYDEEVPPVVLSMNDLQIGFIVCFVPLILSVFAFIVEITIQKLKLLVKNIKDALTATFVVAAFATIRHT